jgi:hypothetical protein
VIAGARSIASEPEKVLLSRPGDHSLRVGTDLWRYLPTREQPAVMASAQKGGLPVVEKIFVIWSDAIGGPLRVGRTVPGGAACPRSST